MDFDNSRCLLNYKDFHTLNHHDTSAKFCKVVDNLLKSRRCPDWPGWLSEEISNFTQKAFAFVFLQKKTVTDFQQGS